MDNLTEQQNLQLGVVAAFIEGVLLQPTLYWKNARAMKLPFTLNPAIIYRGTAASIFNEMQMMGLQFLLTSKIQRLFIGNSGKKMTNEQVIYSALLGGVISANAASPVELVMIQQQRFGGSFFSTPVRVAKTFGVGFKGIFRGLFPAMVRDSIYVTGMLGVTPLVQKYLVEKHHQDKNSASLIASIIGGVFGAVLSQPMDVVKTVMQGDLERTTYGGVASTVKQVWSEGGIHRVFNGCFWRTCNIVGTVYIANECCNRLPHYMFGTNSHHSSSSGGTSASE